MGGSNLPLWVPPERALAVPEYPRPDFHISFFVERRVRIEHTLSYSELRRRLRLRDNFPDLAIPDTLRGTLDNFATEFHDLFPTGGLIYTSGVLAWDIYNEDLFY